MTNPAPTATATADTAVTQLRELGDRTVETGRQLGRLAVDTYEKTVVSFVEFEHRAAKATPNDLVRAAIQAHAQFVDEINGAYIKALRGVLPN